MSPNRDSSSKQIALLHVSSSKDKNIFLAAVFKSMGTKSQTTCQIEFIQNLFLGATNIKTKVHFESFKLE